MATLDRSWTWASTFVGVAVALTLSAYGTETHTKVLQAKNMMYPGATLIGIAAGFLVLTLGHAAAVRGFIDRDARAGHVERVATLATGAIAQAAAGLLAFAGSGYWSIDTYLAWEPWLLAVTAVSGTFAGFRWLVPEFIREEDRLRPGRVAALVAVPLALVGGIVLVRATAPTQPSIVLILLLVGCILGFGLYSADAMADIRTGTWRRAGVASGALSSLSIAAVALSLGIVVAAWIYSGEDDLTYLQPAAIFLAVAAVFAFVVSLVESDEPEG